MPRVTAAFVFDGRGEFMGKISQESSDKSYRAKREEDFSRSGLEMALTFLNEIRRLNADQEGKFYRSFDSAVKDLKEKAFSWFVTLSAVAVLSGGFLYKLGESYIKYTVSEKVNREFREYSKDRINKEVENSSNELRVKYEEVQKGLVTQSLLVKLYSEAMSGSLDAYLSLQEKTRRESDSEHSVIAENLLRAIETYYKSQMVRRADNYCMHELAWKFKKVDLSNEEIITRLQSSNEITGELLNLILNLSGRDDGQRYTDLYISKLSQCKDLVSITTIVDCISSFYPDCPKTLDIASVISWWESCKERR